MATLQQMLDLFDPTPPLERARTIPACWYSDPEIEAAERRSVFHNTWQAVGRLDQVASPGTFFTAELAGEPLVVVRDEAGVLRAFHNVCRHRAARVAPEPEGRATRFRCRYHGWTYDLAGRLRGTPEFDGVAEFDRAANGLVAVAVDNWGPLVWVHLGPTFLPLADFLCPLPDRTLGLGVERLRFVQRREYTLRCNWKVYVDNYLDGGYHVSTIHPGLAGVLDYSQYRTEIAGHTSVQVSPLKSPETAPVVGHVRTGDAAYYWWLFPNVMLNLYQGVMDTNLVLPLGVDSCRVIFDFYFDRGEGEADRRFIADSTAVAHQIQQEDVDICEEVQRGLGSRAYEAGRFSVKREAGVYHFHRLLAEHLRARV